MKFKIGDKVRIERINEVISDDVMKKYRGSIGYITSESKYDKWVKLTVDNERYNWYEGWLELVEDNKGDDNMNDREKLEYALQLLNMTEEELVEDKENNKYEDIIKPFVYKISTEMEDCDCDCSSCIYNTDKEKDDILLLGCTTRKTIHYLYKKGYLKLDK